MGILQERVAWSDRILLPLTQRGCPPDLEPDLDTFYRDWLGRQLPDEKTFEDRTLETVRGWAR